MEIDKDTMDKLFTGPTMLIINGRKTLIGRNFLGIKGEIISRIDFNDEVILKTVEFEKKDLTVRIESSLLHGLLHRKTAIQFSQGIYGIEDILLESTSIYFHYMGRYVQQTNWPAIHWGNKEILIAKPDMGGIDLIILEKVEVRFINARIHKSDPYDNSPFVVWRHDYQDGPDSIRLVYVEYKRKKWSWIEVINEREVLYSKLCPGDSDFIWIFRRSKKDLAAEVWVYHNRKRVRTYDIFNHVYERDKDKEGSYI